MTEVTKIEQVGAQVEVRESAALMAADPMVSMIERVATDPNSDLDKLERILQLRADHEDREDKKRARQAERDFNQALAQCQAEMPVVGKNKSNSHTQSKYTDLAGIMSAVSPIIARHGFAIQFNPGQSPDQHTIAVDWTLTHSGGHSRNGTGFYPLDAAGTGGKTNKTAIQAQGSSRTYARRYLMIDLFNIATSDDIDGQAIRQVNKGITEAQYREIGKQLERTGFDEAVMLQAAGVDDISDMTEAKAAGVLKTLFKKPDAPQ